MKIESDKIKTELGNFTLTLEVADNMDRNSIILCVNWLNECAEKIGKQMDENRRLSL